MGLLDRWRRRPDADPGAAGSAATPPVVQPDAAAWRSLPPMTPAVQRIETVLARSGFEGGLATRQNPSFLAPLAHGVTDEAPSGAVHGLFDVGPAVPGAPLLRSSPAPVPGVQRFAPAPTAPQPRITASAPQPPSAPAAPATAEPVDQVDRSFALPVAEPVDHLPEPAAEPVAEPVAPASLEQAPEPTAVSGSLVAGGSTAQRAADPAPQPVAAPAVQRSADADRPETMLEPGQTAFDVVEERPAPAAQAPLLARPPAPPASPGSPVDTTGDANGSQTLPSVPRDVQRQLQQPPARPPHGGLGAPLPRVQRLPGPPAPVPSTPRPVAAAPASPSLQRTATPPAGPGASASAPSNPRPSVPGDAQPLPQRFGTPADLPPGAQLDGDAAAATSTETEDEPEHPGHPGHPEHGETPGDAGEPGDRAEPDDTVDTVDTDVPLLAATPLLVAPVLDVPPGNTVDSVPASPPAIGLQPTVQPTVQRAALGDAPRPTAPPAGRPASPVAPVLPHEVADVARRPDPAQPLPVPPLFESPLQAGVVQRQVPLGAPLPAARSRALQPEGEPARAAAELPTASAVVPAVVRSSAPVGLEEWAQTVVARTTGVPEVPVTGPADPGTTVLAELPTLGPVPGVVGPAEAPAAHVQRVLTGQPPAQSHGQPVARSLAQPLAEPPGTDLPPPSPSTAATTASVLPAGTGDGPVAHAEEPWPGTSLDAVPDVVPLLPQRPADLVAAAPYGSSSTTSTGPATPGAVPASGTVQRRAAELPRPAVDPGPAGGPTLVGPSAGHPFDASVPDALVAAPAAAPAADIQRTVAEALSHRTQRPVLGVSPTTGTSRAGEGEPPGVGVQRAVAAAATGAAARMMATGLGHIDGTGALVLDLPGAPPPSTSPSAQPSSSTSAFAASSPGWAPTAIGASGRVQRSTPWSDAVAHDAPPATRPATVEFSESAPAVQAVAAGDELPPADAGDPALSASGTAPAEPAVGSVPSAAPGAATAAEAVGPLAALPMDELVRQLFDPLCARIKAELRLDRERAGFLTDLHR